MGAKRGLLLLVAVVVLALQQYPHQVSGWLAGRVHMRIINTLEPSKANLTVHCKSGDDDLGFHQLAFGETYEFSFKNNVWDSTLFFCCFQWTRPDDGYVWSTSFDVYRARRDQERCVHHCTWLVGETGFYSYSGITKIWENLYTWPKQTTTWC